MKYGKVPDQVQYEQKKSSLDSPQLLTPFCNDAYYIVSINGAFISLDETKFSRCEVRSGRRAPGTRYFEVLTGALEATQNSKPFKRESSVSRYQFLTSKTCEWTCTREVP